MTTTTTHSRPAARRRHWTNAFATTCGQLNACYADLVELLGEAVAGGAWPGWDPFGGALDRLAYWSVRFALPDPRGLVAQPRHTRGLSRRSRRGSCRSIRPVSRSRLVRRHEGDVAMWARVMTLSQLRFAVRASKVSGADRDAAAAKRAGRRCRTVPQPPNPRSGAGASSRRVSVVATGRGWVVAAARPPRRRSRGALDAAMSKARDRLFRDGQRDVTWVDALVDIAERSVDAAPIERRERTAINLFIDPDLRRR